MDISKIIITIKGAVQGVGFRPFVYRAAMSLNLRGWVRNDCAGLEILTCGERKNLDVFISTVKTDHPPLADIRSIEINEEPVCEIPESFTIMESSSGEIAEVDVTRDVAVCEACLAEMHDPANRRFGHPFINCTDCGPRYTIIKDLPYDRPATTMAEFPLCPECNREYSLPGNRRFHAQPICCPSCGPVLRLIDSGGKDIPGDPVKECAVLLDSGKIVAIKSIGGFHLACRADDENAVALLRQRKNRERKPFAVMMRDLETVKRFASIGIAEISLLTSIERPIVICACKKTEGLAPNIAPGTSTIGIMLPYTPVHYLVFDGGKFDALVMTSGNATDEPIVYNDEEVTARLGGIADAFLTHDRKIYIRNDDSITRVISGNAVMMRRSRGYVPDPLPSPYNVQGGVALGGVLKSTVAVGRKLMCYMSQYIGAVNTVEDIGELKKVVYHLLHILGVTPEFYAGDMHPDAVFRHIVEPGGIPLVKVQHHHAHAVACMAENGLCGKAICIVYDGTGYGIDGCVWGGELLVSGHADFTRQGHLKYMPMPGAESAIYNPGRMALAALYTIMGDNAAETCPWMPDDEKFAVMEMLAANVNCPATSSMGRLFDAASAMLGICKKRTYEGHPAMELEYAADFLECGEYEPCVKMDKGDIVIDGAEILAQTYNDFVNGASPEKAAARFHNTISRATVKAAQIAAYATGLSGVCLSGGCFQNALLLTRTIAMLTESGLTPYIHRRLPPNDECISYGQLIVAGAQRSNSIPQ